MVSQRRRREWVSVETIGVPLQLTNALTPAFLITDFLANMGLAESQYGGVTIGSIIGWIQAVSNAESTPSSVSGHLSFGIGVFPERLTTANPASAQIPDPQVVTTLEGNWWWRWTTPRIYSDPTNQPASLSWPYFPANQGTVPVNIRSMRKLKNGEHVALVASQQGWTTTYEPAVRAWFRVLCLLP